MESSIVEIYEGRFEFYRCCMAVTAALSIPLTALVVYLILWKSPKPMRIYKFLLLNISVWAFITDMLLEIISLPLPVLEVFGLYSVGLSRSLPSPVGFASVVATMFCIFEYLVGLLFAFYHRYYVLQDEVSILGKTLFHLAQRRLRWASHTY
ncbi:hypothetical protein QR680_015596 [Steinernema hermaphroditum]|uniref:G-protein coupled receptors family 1 profile domain-containing protein n=1 Tax=Steinernema hermaphroditum TaxID=289476 RepID=A0AA39HAX4_9BILA|nr:hypothetical protein QR680_015596 [Steinernema hermaphroditum]